MGCSLTEWFGAPLVAEGACEQVKARANACQELPEVPVKINGLDIANRAVGGAVSGILICLTGAKPCGGCLEGKAESGGGAFLLDPDRGLQRGQALARQAAKSAVEERGKGSESGVRERPEVQCEEGRRMGLGNRGGQSAAGNPRRGRTDWDSRGARAFASRDERPVGAPYFKPNVAGA
jgi:hypothetical protein